MGGEVREYSRGNEGVVWGMIVGRRLSDVGLPLGSGRWWVGWIDGRKKLED